MNYTCETCEATYKHKTNLTRHKKTCIPQNNQPDVQQLQHDNQELKQQLKDHINHYKERQLYIDRLIKIKINDDNQIIQMRKQLQEKENTITLMDKTIDAANRKLLEVCNIYEKLYEKCS